MSPIVADINTTFPKGASFAQWLKNAGSAAPLGKLNLIDAQHTVVGVDETTPAGLDAPRATSWVSIPSPFEKGGAASGKPSVQYFTVNTPVNKLVAQQCGRMVVSDIHVSGNPSSKEFPTLCNNDPLRDQEKALIFMLFDLTACVSSDTGGGGTTPVCVKKSCAEQNIVCGPSGDGCGGLIADCGTCPAGQTCGGGGPGLCGSGGGTCTPKTCAQLSANCGPIADGCGALLDCGGCVKGSCGGGGIANQCGGGVN
jgi:hypothetical protein